MMIAWVKNVMRKIKKISTGVLLRHDPLKLPQDCWRDPLKVVVEGPMDPFKILVNGRPFVFVKRGHFIESSAILVHSSPNKTLSSTFATFALSDGSAFAVATFYFFFFQ